MPTQEATSPSPQAMQVMEEQVEPEATEVQQAEVAQEQMATEETAEQELLEAMPMLEEDSAAKTLQSSPIFIQPASLQALREHQAVEAQEVRREQEVAADPQEVPEAQEPAPRCSMWEALLATRLVEAIQPTTGILLPQEKATVSETAPTPQA